MRNAARILIVAFGATALAACSKQPSHNEAAGQEMSIDGNLAQGQIPPNAEIETLPPDESSVDTNGELVAGDDNPDVNGFGNSH